VVFDPLLPALRAAIKANAEGVYAKTGRLNSDGTYTLLVPDRANFIYARLNGDTQSVIEALNLKVQLRPDMPVRVRRNEGGVWEVVDAYPQEVSEALGTAAPAMNRPPADGDAVQETVGARSYKPGRVRLSDAGGLLVYVEPFDYWWDGARKHFPGGAIDLTSYRPTPANHYAWVQIYVEPDTNTLSAQTGTARALRSLLTTDDRMNINIGSGIPVDAVVLRQGQTDAPRENDFAFSRTLLQWRGPNLRVRELDGTPNVYPVREIRVSNGTLADIGNGVVSIDTGGGGGGGGSILDDVFTYLAQSNTDPRDALLTSGSLIAFVYFSSHNANSWKSATNATYTVPTGKKLVVLAAMTTGDNVVDSAARRTRLFNSTDSAVVVQPTAAGNGFLHGFNFLWQNDLAPGAFPEVAAGKTAVMQIWNLDTTQRSTGGVVIAYEANV